MKTDGPCENHPPLIEKSTSTAEKLRHFFVNYCGPPRPNIPAEQCQDSHARGHVLLTQEIDCMKLLAYCPELSSSLFGSTLEFLDVLKTQCSTLCHEAGQAVGPEEITIRLTHIPMLVDTPSSLPHRGGELVRICGSIVRMGMKRVVPCIYRLMCARCDNLVKIYTHPYNRSEAPPCHCKRSGCRNEEMQLVGQNWIDYCECRLQPRSNQSGKLPRSIVVTLENELVMSCNVGQFVEIVGMLFTKWSHMGPFTRPTINLTIWALHVLPMEAYHAVAHGRSGNTLVSSRRRAGHSVRRTKFSPAQFFTSLCKDKHNLGIALAKSTCPQLSGLFAPRMSILLSAVNGASTAGKASLHIRSTIHVLFVGDPSTGKSQLLRFAALVAPRSTSTTGMGSTSAGLTVAATKEMGEFVLEPGALVLSDGGVCVIDELRTVSPADRASLHEAMEQQTISVAKGGLVTKLRTACSVLSACNPPPNRSGSYVTEIGVGGPLLSRFDLIFLLWDRHQKDGDEQIAEHVLSCSIAYRHPDPPLDHEELASYLWWVRAQYAHVDGPLLSDGATELLARYYDLQRRRGTTPLLDDVLPVTIRFLESLIRITQAHAKLHMQSTCSIRDASMALFLMERTAYSLKIPLRSLRENLYSSSLELDEVFLKCDKESLQHQEAVLAAIASVVQHCYTYVPSSPTFSSFNIDSWNLSEAFLTPLLTNSETEKHVEREGNFLVERRVAQIRNIHCSINMDSPDVATQKSIHQLSRKISMSFTTPCTRSCYPSDFGNTQSTLVYPLKRLLFADEANLDLHMTLPNDANHSKIPVDTGGNIVNAKCPSLVKDKHLGFVFQEKRLDAEAPRSKSLNPSVCNFVPMATVNHTDDPQAHPVRQSPRTNLKRKRTAEDIMQSLRLKF